MKLVEREQHDPLAEARLCRDLLRSPLAVAAFEHGSRGRVQTVRLVPLEVVDQELIASRAENQIAFPG